MREVLTAVILLTVTARTAGAGPCGGGPGAPAQITELAEPGLTFPTGLTVAPDGAIWVASTFADELVRVAPPSFRITRVRLPLRSHPVGLAADAQGRIWFAGSGVGLVGRLTPGGTRAAEFPPPSLLREAALPFVAAVALDPRGENAWFTVGPQATVALIPISAEPVRRGTEVREVAVGSGRSRPEGIAVDGEGGVWVTELDGDVLSRIGSDGSVRRLPLPAGSRPRGVAVAPDGSVWVALFGSHQLLRVNRASGAMESWPMPSGSQSNPWAIAVDASGGVWIGEFTANTVTCFDPRRLRFAQWPVPTPHAGVRALAVDRDGRAWFVGSYSGRLGFVGPALPRGRMGAR